MTLLAASRISSSDAVKGRPMDGKTPLVNEGRQGIITYSTESN